MTDNNKPQFEEEQPIIVPLTPPLSQPVEPKPSITIKGGIDKVGGTTKGMTTDTGRFEEN